MKFFSEEIYLNYASTSFPKSKIALKSFYKSISNPPEGSRQNKSNSIINNLRKRVASILKVQDEHVFFTHSATIGLNQVIKGFVKKKNLIFIDNRSHNALIRPWRVLAEHCECNIGSIYNEEDQLIESKLKDITLLSPQLLCLTHVSNVNGSIYPLEKIIDLVKSLSPSTSILVDASQSAGALDLSILNKADFIVFPSHKHLHSLPGAAILITKKKLKPLIDGGTGENSFAEESLSSHELFAEVGTMNFPAIQAMVDSLEYATLKMETHRKLEKNLVDQFLDGVSQIEGLELIGKRSSEGRVAIVALKPLFGSSELHWAPFLQSQKIIIRGGVHCSPLHHQQLGLSRQGTLRFSFGWNTTSEQIEKAIQALKEFSRVGRMIFK